MTASIREWRNEAWETGEKARSQEELQAMARDIIANATEIENKPTPGSYKDSLSRVLVCKSDMIPGTEYVIHVSGFTVSDIAEIVRS